MKRIQITEKLERYIDKTIFNGKNSKWSKKLTYIILNVIIMLVLFFLILNRLLYNWTGTLYPEGSGFHLDTLLDNLIPFVPEMAIFYVFLF